MHGNAVAAAKRFIDDLERTGWEVTGEYTNIATPLDVVCPNGHPTTVVRRSFTGSCNTCRGAHGQRGAARRFRANGWMD